MSRRVPLLVSVLACAPLLAAGCGGSTTYTLAKTKACLEARPGVTVTKRVDFVASTALGGALNVGFRDNRVTLAFALDQPEVERIVRAYERFHGRNIGLPDVLRPTHNVVALWAVHPSGAYLRTIHDCLK